MKPYVNKTTLLLWSLLLILLTPALSGCDSNDDDDTQGNGGGLLGILDDVGDGGDGDGGDDGDEGGGGIDFGGGDDDPCEAERYAIGDQLQDALEGGDCNQDGRLVDAYQFDLAAPAEVLIVMASPDVDALLLLADAETGEQIAQDDDGGAALVGQIDGIGETDAFIQANLAAGSYILLATSASPGESGRYILASDVSDGGGVEPIEGGGGGNPSCSVDETFQINVEVAGTLEAGDCITDDGQLVDPYAFELSASTQLAILMVSQDVDPLLFVVDAATGEVVTVDDDGGADFVDRVEGLSETDAVIVETFPAGRYILAASSAIPGQTGAYALAAVDAGAAKRPVVLNGVDPAQLDPEQLTWRPLDLRSLR